MRALARHLVRTRAAAAHSTQAAQQQRVALVQGASRGLGLEFVRQLLERPQQVVVATCRRPEEAQQLQELQQQCPALHIVQLDCCDEGSIEQAAAEVAGVVPSLDLIINVAGVLHNSAGLAPGSTMYYMIAS
jgi:NAD(P)-dependent dehydrogenase (short-subunit alcohol dehydrogenase family)